MMHVYVSFRGYVHMSAVARGARGMRSLWDWDEWAIFLVGMLGTKARSFARAAHALNY